MSWHKYAKMKKTTKENKIIYTIEGDGELPEKYNKTGKDYGSGSLSIVASVFLVFLMVVTTVYSLYKFLHVSGISDLAGVHVTDSLQGVTNEIVNGKSEVIPGYEGWLTYKNDSFELKYPSEMVMQRLDAGDDAISLKRYNNTVKKGTESLAMTILTGEFDLADNQSIKDVALLKGIAWDDNWKVSLINGKNGIRTGETKTNSGIVRDAILWQVNDKVYILEGDYLSANILENRAIFEKILAQFKFIQSYGNNIY